VKNHITEEKLQHFIEVRNDQRINQNKNIFNQPETIDKRTIKKVAVIGSELYLGIACHFAIW
jgi:uncharacterized membrane protein